MALRDPLRHYAPPVASAAMSRSVSSGAAFREPFKARARAPIRTHSSRRKLANGHQHANCVLLHFALTRAQIKRTTCAARNAASSPPKGGTRNAASSIYLAYQHGRTPTPPSQPQVPPRRQRLRADLRPHTQIVATPSQSSFQFLTLSPMLLRRALARTIHFPLSGDGSSRGLKWLARDEPSPAHRMIGCVNKPT